MKTSSFGTGGECARRFVIATLLIAVCSCIIPAAAADETTFDRIVENLEQNAPLKENSADSNRALTSPYTKISAHEGLMITRSDQNTLHISGGVDQKKKIITMISAEFAHSSESAKVSASHSLHDYDRYRMPFKRSYLTGISDITGVYIPEGAIAYDGKKVSGTQVGQWEGSNPVNADVITLQSTLKVNEEKSYFTLPGGYGYDWIRVSGQELKWSDYWMNEWLTVHRYMNFKAFGDYSAPQVNQYDMASFRFGREVNTVHTDVHI